MGRVGSALDNAVIESWHSTVEFELRQLEHFTTKAQARGGSRPGSRSTTTTGVTPRWGCAPRSPTSSPCSAGDLDDSREHGGMNDRIPRTEHDPVLAGVKATPCGWPTASLDPGCGRGPKRASGSRPLHESTKSGLYGFRGLPTLARWLTTGTSPTRRWTSGWKSLRRSTGRLPTSSSTRCRRSARTSIPARNSRTQPTRSGRAWSTSGGRSTTSSTRSGGLQEQTRTGWTLSLPPSRRSTTRRRIRRAQAAVMALEHADWLGMVIGLVRRGVGAVFAPEKCRTTSWLSRGSRARSRTLTGTSPYSPRPS